MTPFNNRQKLVAMTIAAGFSISMTAYAFEPPQIPSDRRTMESERNNAQRSNTTHFHSFKNDIKGKDLLDPSGETIASISDLALDRGSGRVRYAVLSFGDTLGIGGDDAIIDISRLNWRFVDHTVSASLSEEQLERLPKLDRTDWNDMEWTDVLDDDRDRQTDRRFDRNQRDDRRDPYKIDMTTARNPQTIEGRIVEVDRFTPDDSRAEYLSVTVQPVRGEKTKVVLGPSWHIMGNEAAPIRGQRISVKAVANPDDRSEWIATEADVEGRTMLLRNREGRPLWLTESSSSSTNGARHPFLMASDIVDAPIEAIGESAGEVHDLLIDVSSGRVGFVAIDPNENFLGMADTIRLAPWTITNFGPDETLRIDATQVMITSSPEVPKEIASLNNELMRTQIFQHFQVRPIDFSSRHDAASKDRRTSANPDYRGWTSHDQYARAVKNGERMELRGTVIAIEKANNFPTVDGPVAVLVVEDQAGAMHRLHLGPDAYVSKNDLQLKPGDKVLLDARKARVNDRPFLVAHRIQRNGDWIIMWNEEGRPAWDNR